MEKIVSRSTAKGFLSFIFICLFQYADAQHIDINWLRSINKPKSDALSGTMQAVSNSAYVVTAGVPFTQLVAGYIKHDTTLIENGWITGAGLGVDLFITLGLKYAIHRPRPHTTYPDIIAYESETSLSFPSGHTSAAFAVATSLSLEYKKWYVAVPAYAWAGTVGYSRMYLGMHYPSDVLVGALVGSGSAWITYKGTAWLQHRGKLKGGLCKWILRK